MGKKLSATAADDGDNASDDDLYIMMMMMMNKVCEHTRCKDWVMNKR